MTCRTRLLACLIMLILVSAPGCRTTSTQAAADDPTTDTAQIDPAAADDQVRIAPMLVRDFGVFLQVSFSDSDPVLMRYDTGSPTTVVDTDHAETIGIEAGEHPARIGTAEIGRRTIRLVDWIEADMTYPGLPGPIKGVVGNDFFADMVVGLHYPEQELWLLEAGEPIDRPDGTEREARSAAFDASSGYLVMPCQLTADADDRICLFDTGAINSLVFTDYWRTVAPASEGGVPMITFDNQGNTIFGSYRRTETVVLGDITLHDSVIVVVDEFALLSRVAAAIGETVVGLIGLSGMFEHYTVIDYAAQTVTAYRYLDREPLFPSPFVGYGFVVASDGRGGLEARAIVPASDAAAAGMAPGDRIVAVDDQPLADAGLEFTIASLIADPPGTRRVFEIDRSGATLHLEIQAEDLLPRSPRP